MSKNTNKLLSNELQAVFKENHIVLMTETWLGDEQSIQVNGFQTF